MPPKKKADGEGTVKRARSASTSSTESATAAPTKRGVAKKEPIGTGTTTGKGWGAVIAKKKQSESKGGKNRPAYMNVKQKFFLKDGESAVIQIHNDEPICHEGCTMPPDHRDFYVSPKSVGKKHCPMVEDGLTLTWKAGFEVFDFRGEYDTEKKKHKNNGEPAERYWLVSQTVATNLHTIAEKKGKKLSELVLEVTRSGSDKKTVYNIAIALDKDDNKIKWQDLEWESEPLEKIFKPLPDDVLNDLLGHGGDAEGTDAVIETEDDDDDN